jgi:aryl-alcohol dehydrogenase-like predicted oxidoreductase
LVELRRLGATELEIAPLVLGGNVFGWTADEPASFAILDTFVDAGGTMVDTADVYSSFVPGNVGGESETVIGNWLTRRKRRDDVQIATKVGMKMADGDGLSAAWIERAAEASLRRLKTDYIDLYFAHRDDGTPQDETMGAFDRLVKAGKVRAIAASNYGADRLESALKTSADKGLARYTALQPWFNLVEQGQIDAATWRVCREHDIGVVPYFSLASGFLTGKYRKPEDLGGRARGGMLQKYVNPKGFALLEAMDAIAAETGASLAQLALAWIIAHPGITAPIASATSTAQLADIMGALRVKLTAAQFEALGAAGRAVGG